MSDVLTVILDNIVQILGTVITAILGYIGFRIKKVYTEYVNDKSKQKIVEKTVKYVEQIGKKFTCEEKKETAKAKVKEWLSEKKLDISETELDILIESTVNCLEQKEVK